MKIKTKSNLGHPHSPHRRFGNGEADSESRVKRLSQNGRGDTTLRPLRVSGSIERGEYGDLASSDVIFCDGGVRAPEEMCCLGLLMGRLNGEAAFGEEGMFVASDGSEFSFS